jgi:hypothetical protein
MLWIHFLNLSFSRVKMFAPWPFEIHSNNIFWQYPSYSDTWTTENNPILFWSSIFRIDHKRNQNGRSGLFFVKTGLWSVAITISHFLYFLLSFPQSLPATLNGNSNAYPIYHAQSKEEENQLLIECKQTVDLKGTQINPGDQEEISWSFEEKNLHQEVEKQECFSPIWKISP